MAITDVATLGIQVTTQGTDAAKRSLDDLAASGDKAAASTARLGKASEDAAKKYASPQYRQQADDLAKLAGQIDPTIAKLGQLDAQQAKLAAFKKSGMLGADDFNALNAAIEANRTKLTSAGEAMSHFSLNNSFARRELGRLASDMANGNWGRFEQTSLTLANASGLLGMAFSGTGAIIAGVVAAVGLGVLAFEKGGAEAEAFSKALLMTGNVAGMTSQQLADMARNIASATNTTEHSSAAVIAQVAGTGKFVGQQIQTVAEAAQQLQETTGQAIKETIKQFVSLGADPSNAIVKLNDEQHFLTLSVYDQIKALQDQGQEQDAANLAMQTYAETIASRTPKITENLGLIEKAWHGIKDAALTAADAAMNIGRQQTDQQKFDVLAGNRESAKSLIDRGMGGDYFQGTTAQKYFDNATAQLAKMQDDRKRQDEQAAEQANQQQAQDAGIRLAREADTYASAEVKRARLIAKAHGDANDAIAKAEKVQDANLRLQLIAQAKANEQAVIAGIESHEKKPRSAKPKSDPFADLNRLRDKAYNQFTDAQSVSDGGDSAQAKLYKDEVTQLQAIAAAGAKAIASGADLAKVQAEVADATGKVTAAFALESQQLSAKDAAALKAYQDAINEQIKAKQQQIDLQVQAVGMGAKEVQQMQAIDAIYAKSAATIEQLNRQRAQKGADIGLIDGQIAAQKAALPILVKQQEDAYKAMDAAQADWKNGAIKAMEDVRDEGQNVAGLTANFFTSAFGSMDNALASFVTTGKLNFSSFATSVLADLAKMELRILESKALQSLMGSFLGGGSDMATSFDSNGSFFSFNANGGVYNSPSLSVYSGQIVDTPTMFAFAQGAGIMGEAGPEAILPLQRGPNGKLGVASGGGGSGVVVNQSINIDNSGGTSQQTSGGDSNALARQFSDKVKQAARETIAQEQRPGGLLWRMQHA